MSQKEKGDFFFKGDIFNRNSSNMWLSAHQGTQIQYCLGWDEEATEIKAIRGDTAPQTQDVIMVCCIMMYSTYGRVYQLLT